MTFPATFSTPYRLIYNAMRDSGYLGKGTEPTSEHLAEYMPKINDLFNYLQTKGLKLWLNQDFPIQLVQGQSQYVLGPGANLIAMKPLRALEGYYVDSNHNRRPIIPMSRQEWDTLSTVTTQGVLNNYFVDKQQLNLLVNVWLTPDAQAATGVFHAVLQYQVGNVVSLTDTMNFPVEWFLALEWGFANQICTGQPQVIMDRCAAMAEKYITDLENWDVEDASTFFTPDTRTMNQGNIQRFNR